MRFGFFLIALYFLSLACGREANTGGVRTDERSPQAPETPESMEESQTNRNLRKWNEGVEFYGAGNEPFWTLSLDYDSIFTFKTPEGPPYNAPPVAADRAQDAAIMRFRTVTESGEMIATLREGQCVDDMSGQTYSHSVQVQVKLGTASDYTTYTGCGRFVVPPVLHDIWALQRLNGEAVDASGLPQGVPTLEFHSGDLRVTGHSGCNNLTGSFAMMGPRSLEFSQLASTRRACPDTSVEDAFLAAISGKRLDFEISEGSMALLRRGEEVARFRKVD